MEQIIEKNIQKLFLNNKVLCYHPYRIIRNADLSIEEEEAADLLKEIQKQLKRRQWGEVIRLEVEDSMDKRLLKILKKELNVEESAIYRINGPLDLTFLMKINGLEGFDHLKYKKYIPQPVKELNHEEDIFTQIRRQDFFFIIPIRPLILLSILSARHPGIPMCWQLSRPFTGSAAIRRLLLPWQRLLKTVSRCLCLWN